MRILVVSLALLAIAMPVSAIDRLADGFPDLPKDARAVAERSVACEHFGGEIGGTGDARDKEVEDQLKALKCDQVEQDLQKMRLKYRENERISKILSEPDLD